MANDSDHKSAAELQREVEQQRSRLEDRIDQIQEKLSPGQLVDELLAYTKGGGGEFISSLQRNVTANPLPVALLGVSLAWLIAKPASTTPSTHSDDRSWDDSINANRGYGDHEDYEDYPVAIIAGSSLQRVTHRADDQGSHYSEFLDDAGKKYRAASDVAGRRAGHFMDETGKRYKGFTNAAGSRIEEFRDEAGNLMDEASGWASHTWQRAREMLHDAQDAINKTSQSGRSHMSSAASGMQNQMGNMQSQLGSLNQTIMSQFRDQPLVAGALAFAAGAAFGAALPHTEQEDKLMGEAADSVKAKAAEQAHDLYDQGREKAQEVYGQAAERASDLYDQVKSGVSEAVPSSGSSGSNASQH
jgi:vacuolar-type H+-ATPase subunit H